MSEKRKDSKGRILNKGEYQRKDLTYEYRFTDVDKVRRSIYAPTLKKLREAEKQVNRDVEDGIIVGRREIVLIDYVKNYLNSKTGKPKTKDNHKRVISFLRKYPFVSMKIKDIKEIDCRKFVIEFSKTHYDETCKKVVYYLSASLKMAVRDGLIRRNPFDFDWHSLLPGKKRKKIALTDEEFESLLDFFKSRGKAYEWYIPIFIFLKETGLRVSEFYGLSLEEVDLEHNTISINHQLYFNPETLTFSLQTPKTKSSRAVIPLTRKAREALIDLMNRCREIVELPDPDGNIQHLFITSKSNKKYKLMNPSRMSVNINRAMKKYNREHPDHPLEFTLHVLRHTAATTMIKDGVNVGAVQKLMRHSSAKMTLEIYTHLNQDDLQNELDRVYGKI